MAFNNIFDAINTGVSDYNSKIKELIDSDSQDNLILDICNADIRTKQKLLLIEAVCIDGDNKNQRANY